MTVAIPDAVFSAVRLCGYTVRPIQSWWRSIVVRPPVLPACFPYPALDWQLAV